jgi:hypothetical protein
LSLSAGTPQLPLVDRDYTISISATNFLGISSPPAILRLSKSSSSLPYISLSTRQSYDPSEGVLLRPITRFSACSGPQTGVSFQWEQLSGPTMGLVSDGERGADRCPKEADSCPSFLTRSPQLYIPPSALSPASSYSLRLTAINDADPSRRTSFEKEFTVR